MSALNTFLASAGITPQVVNDACYAKSEDEITKDDALTRALAAAAQAQAQRMDEQKKAEADRAVMERWQLGAMVVLSLLVLTLIGLLVMRDRRHRLESIARKRTRRPPSRRKPRRPATPKAVKPAKIEKPKVVKAPPKHPIPWGWILLGLIIIVAVVAFLIKDHDIYTRLTAPRSATAASPAVVHMVCEVDRAASPNPLSAAGPTDFEFDALHACVNGRTPYERQADGTLLRFTVSDSDPVAARMELSADGATFKRSDYRLDPVQHKAYLDQRTALGSLRCSADMDAGATAALNDNLARVRSLSQTYLAAQPDTQTVWRCHRKVTSSFQSQT